MTWKTWHGIRVIIRGLLWLGLWFKVGVGVRWEWEFDVLGAYVGFQGSHQWRRGNELF